MKTRKTSLGIGRTEKFESDRRVDFVRTDVSEECITSIIRVTRIDELRTMLVVTSGRYTQRNSDASYCQRCFRIALSFDPDNVGDTLLRNIGSYNSHTA
jgi:hypothetical protein